MPTAGEHDQLHFHVISHYITVLSAYGCLFPFKAWGDPRTHRHTHDCTQPHTVKHILYICSTSYVRSHKILHSHIPDNVSLMVGGGGGDTRLYNDQRNSLCEWSAALSGQRFIYTWWSYADLHLYSLDISGISKDIKGCYFKIFKGNASLFYRGII